MRGRMHNDRVPAPSNKDNKDQADKRHFFLDVFYPCFRHIAVADLWSPDKRYPADRCQRNNISIGRASAHFKVQMGLGGMGCRFPAPIPL